MNAQQLKNSILQEAIEGRLVPQDPNDEPASVLLERIREEKKRLFKEGKLKKKDLEETPISEDEKPFEIPKGWVWVRWGALGEYKKGPFGSSLTKSMFVPKSDKAIKVYEQKNAIQKDYSLGEYYISEEKYEEMKGFTIHPGDIIVSCAGTIGETYLLPQEAPVGIINQALMRAKIHLESIIPYWLLYFRYILLIENRLKGAGSAIKNIPPFEVLKAMPVALPPLAEQKRIVAKIEELLPKVEEYGKAQDALNKLNEELPERLKKSILQEAIEGRLVPQDPNDEPASVLLDKIRSEKKRLVKEGKLKKKDLEETPISEDEIPYKIPESWEWVRIKTIFDVCSARRVHEKDWRTSGIPFYRAREIGKLADNGFVDNDLFIDQQLYDEFSQSGVPKEGDLMITAVGTLGKVYIVKEGEIFYYKDGSVLCMENKWRINPQYAKYVIESPVFINQYIGESQGTTVATLTMVRVNQYFFPLPPLAEQKRIVAKIEELFSVLDSIKESLE